MPAVSKPEGVERKIMRLILRYMGMPIYEHNAAAEEAPGGVLWFKEERRRGQS